MMCRRRLTSRQIRYGHHDAFLLAGRHAQASDAAGHELDAFYLRWCASPAEDPKNKFGNRVEYTLDAAGNHTAENTYDTSSVLTSNPDASVQ